MKVLELAMFYIIAIQRNSEESLYRPKIFLGDVNVANHTIYQFMSKVCQITANTLHTSFKKLCPLFISFSFSLHVCVLSVST